MKLLDEFMEHPRNKELITTLILEKDNLVIGGSLALQLHGLNAWQSGDLDIIIYEPTSRQRAIVEEKMLPCFDYDTEEDKLKDVRVFKWNTGIFEMNIIFTSDLLPEDAMRYKGYLVNPVNLIIKAKIEYASLRLKDIIHLQTLKNNNFNYEKS